MSNSMIERVARALCKHGEADCWRTHMEDARAAISAMRLAGNGCPLEDAGINTLDAVMPEENDVQRGHFVAAFNAVIDAALK